MVQANPLKQADVDGLEVIVAEREEAAHLVRLTRSLHRVDDPYRPAILVITANSDGLIKHEAEEAFDGVMPLPQLPAKVAELLSIALYAHRAFCATV